MDKNNIHYRLNRFIDNFSLVLLGSIALGIVGILMKVLAWPAGGFVFVFAMSVLALIMMVQIGLSFIYIVSNLQLAMLGAFCSLGLVMGFLAIIFRYQVWLGWQIMLFVSLPVYLFSGAFLVYFLLHRKELHATHRKFLVKNLVIPFSFTMVLFLISFVLKPDHFYDTFKARQARHEIYFKTAPGLKD